MSEVEKYLADHETENDVLIQLIRVFLFEDDMRFGLELLTITISELIDERERMKLSSVDSREVDDINTRSMLKSRLL